MLIFFSMAHGSKVLYELMDLLGGQLLELHPCSQHRLEPPSCDLASRLRSYLLHTTLSTSVGKHDSSRVHPKCDGMRSLRDIVLETPKMIVLRDRTIWFLVQCTSLNTRSQSLPTPTIMSIVNYWYLLPLSYTSHGELLENMTTRKYSATDLAAIFSQKYIVMDNVLCVRAEPIQMHSKSLQRACKR